MPESVAVTKVSKGNVEAFVSEVGYIAADDTITVYSPVAGKVSEVMFKNYDTVAAGDVMVKYDMTSFEENLKMAQVNKKYAQDGYNAAVSKNNEYKDMLNQASVEGEANKQIYANLIEDRDELLYVQEGRNQTIQYNINKIEAQLVTLNTELAVAQAAVESAGDNEDAIKDAQNKINSLQSQISSNRTALMSVDTRSMTLEEYNVYLEVQRQLDLIERFWNQNKESENIAKQAIVSESQIAQYSDSIELAAIAETQANRNLELAEGGLSATCEGTIVEKLVDAGSYVEAGTPLFVVQPESGYKAKVMISRFDIGSVEVGQAADITIGNSVYKGEVESISPIAEMDSSNKPKVKVFVKITDEGNMPTIGLEADVKIHTMEKSEVLTVDSSAVYTDDSGSYVYVLDNGKIARRDITVGASGNGVTEVFSGLSENEEVITASVSEDQIGERRMAE